MKVVGTAGHIDHGKSALVRRLTDIDPDRLEEEKRRGMTIDLGFAWFQLPSGEPVSVVDVPGHERFIRNMLAGAGGIDVALIVIAADEGVMPQTREHVDILQLLGVHRAAVALSKVDLVDEEWLALVMEDVRAYLSDTTLADAPLVPVSAVTGEGIPDLVTILQKQIASVPSRVDGQFPWMPVDRCFTARGFGTIVTGTLHGGALRTGDVVEITPQGTHTRIRNMQVHQRDVTQADVGARVALNVTNVPREGVSRGDMVALPRSVTAISRFDAHVQVLAHSPLPLRDGAEVAIHIGAAERQAVLRVMSGGEIRPGAQGWIRIKTNARVPVVRNQHFILRLPTPARTFAGGHAVDVRPTLRLHDERALSRLQAMDGQGEAERVGAILLDHQLYSVEMLSARSGLGTDSIQGYLDALVREDKIARVGQIYIHRERWLDTVHRVREILQDYHHHFPLAAGMPREELRQRLRWPAQEWTTALERMQAASHVELRASLVMLEGYRSGLEHRRADADLVLRRLVASPLSPPSAADLLREEGVDQHLLRAMVDAGEIVAVNSDLYYERRALDDVVEIVVRELREKNVVTVAQVRDLLRTSRKYALALVEYLDDQRITRRSGDMRVLGPRAPACA